MAINTGTKLAFVTVFDAKLYTFNSANIGATATATKNTVAGGAPLATIDSLSTSNLVATGPELTIQGGVDNNVLIKHGKSMRCEMQDVLANMDALEALGMVELGDAGSVHTSEKFGAPVTIIGSTILIDEATGTESIHELIIYKFLPDSIMSLNLGTDSAAVFDLNGDVEAIDVAGDSSFYTIF